MGLKCRLLGHDYGEPEVERSREEQGDEVIVTVREVQVCDRCGAEDLVSQNREVTAIRSPSEVGLDEDPSGAGGDERIPNDPTPPAGAESRADSSVRDDANDPAGDGDPAPSPDSTVEPADLDEVSPDSAGSSAVERAPDLSASGRPADEGAADESDEVSEVIDSVDDAPDADSATAAGDGANVSPADLDADGADGGESGADDGWETGSDDWDDVDTDPDADDAVILDAGRAERDEAQWPEETDTGPVDGSEETADAPAADADEQVTNDAEIIDGDDDAESDAGDRADDGRAPGAWPEREDLPGADGDAGATEAVPGGAGTSDGDGWPDVDGDDEGYDASPGGEGDLELGGGGLTPEVNGHADAEADGADAVEGVAVEEGPGIGRSDRNESHGGGFVRTPESGTLESDVPDDRIEFYCPNCGHARMAGASSLRAGDICPECKQGYIAEREQ